VCNGTVGVSQVTYHNSCRSDGVHANVHSEPVRNHNDVWIWCWSRGCGEWRLYDCTCLLTVDIYGMYTVHSCTCTICIQYTVALAQYVYSTQLHLHNMYTVHSCTCTICIQQTVALAQYVYSKQLHLHNMYTANSCTCAICIQYTVAFAQYVCSKQLHSTNGRQTRTAHSHHVWPAVISFEKQLKFMFQRAVIDLALLFLIFRIKHAVSLETGVMTSQMISHFQMDLWRLLVWT
jgi:hypothetical protein